MVIGALDPGRDKCGIAVLSGGDGAPTRVLCQNVIETKKLEEEAAALVAAFSPTCFVCGNGTTSARATQRLADCTGLPVEVVDEYRTTELAKKKYWEAHPPRGLRRLLPTGMQVPPVPVDDYVAVILGTRYLEGKESQKP